MAAKSKGTRLLFYAPINRLSSSGVVDSLIARIRRWTSQDSIPSLMPSLFLGLERSRCLDRQRVRGYRPNQRHHLK